ncbi:Bromodomain containing protein [Histomonas meleagridis]|uniref:Bromodomain containing protein n=1 Tax=Histomonas meleagridis TaxID=135588 RepID=UPI00355ABF26|nr:Bromodomain containing protein [Histomonas meleagridis]KAH0800112.1 Bromodomain containing protein [Histomonas meleagridis]
MLSDYDKDWCTRIHQELLKKPISNPFKMPVDPVRDGAENYFEIVKNPMDLNTIKNKIHDNKYKTVEEFVADIHLICDNAIKFNGENSMFAYIANDLRTWIDEQFKKKPNSHEEEWHNKLIESVERLYEHVKTSPTGMSDPTVAAIINSV